MRDVTFEALGQAWKLRLGVNALADLEAATGMSINEVFAQVDGAKLKVGTLRLIVQAALSQSHPGVTIKQAGDIMDDVGLTEVAGLIGEAAKAAFPESVGEPQAGA